MLKDQTYPLHVLGPVQYVVEAIQLRILQAVPVEWNLGGSGALRGDSTGCCCRLPEGCGQEDATNHATNHDNDCGSRQSDGDRGSVIGTATRIVGRADATTGETKVGFTGRYSAVVPIYCASLS